MTNSEKQQWKQERAKGKNRFLLRSLLVNGIPYGTVMILATTLPPIFKHQPIEQGTVELIGLFGFYVVAFGAAMGDYFWRRKEKDYNKPTEEED